MTKQHYYATLLLNLALLCFATWLIQTEPGERVLARARGYATATQILWRVARWLGRAAMRIELKYHKEVEGLQ
jgi:hypothetical protein